MRVFSDIFYLFLYYCFEYISFILNTIIINNHKHIVLLPRAITFISCRRCHCHPKNTDRLNDKHKYEHCVSMCLIVILDAHRVRDKKRERERGKHSLGPVGWVALLHVWERNKKRETKRGRTVGQVESNSVRHRPPNLTFRDCLSFCERLRRTHKWTYSKFVCVWEGKRYLFKCCLVSVPFSYKLSSLTLSALSQTLSSDQYKWCIVFDG